MESTPEDLQNADKSKTSQPPVGLGDIFRGIGKQGK